MVRTPYGPGILHLRNVAYCLDMAASLVSLRKRYQQGLFWDDRENATKRLDDSVVCQLTSRRISGDPSLISSTQSGPVRGTAQQSAQLNLEPHFCQPYRISEVLYPSTDVESLAGLRLNTKAQQLQIHVCYMAGFPMDKAREQVLRSRQPGASSDG